MGVSYTALGRFAVSFAFCIRMSSVQRIYIVILLSLSGLLVPACSWASHGASLVTQVRMDGSRLSVYGQQLFRGVDHRVYFGAKDAEYLLEPRVLKVDSRRIEVLLPFQPISGDYWLKIGPSVDAPALTTLLRVENDTMSIASEDYDPEFDRLVQHSSAQKNREVVLASGADGSCLDDEPDCIEARTVAVGPAFCGAAADFDPFEGSQAMTVKGTEELHLDEYYTIEARVFIREYVRSGIIVDKYSGGGRGREYRLSVNKEGLLRSWFSIDGTLNNSRTVLSTAPVPKNKWVHVASTFDGRYVRLFIDGVQVSEKRIAGRPAQLGYQNIAIGGNNCCRGYYEVLNGLIDEVRISTVARYRESFEVPRSEFEPDANTQLLMHFTNSGENVGIIGGAAELTELDRITACG
ncbi:LamG domain-containing protein [bacterium]|nr:LamG domain-containing protein [bacterium]